MNRLLSILLLWVFAGLMPCEACTSAIVSGRLTANGRPLLWKNRDTNDQNNRIERIAAHDGMLEFVALFDARDTRDTAAWMGMNERGFAIMNTASYNLNDDNVPEADMDKEGVVMRAALERCVTVDDFAQLLQTWPQPRGIEANFGVIDANGSGAYFEVGNYGEARRYDLSDAPRGILVRTNYSYSGREGAGYGYIREQNELHLLAPHIAAHDITPAVFTEELSRTFYHDVQGEDFTHSGHKWLVDQDFIPRRISTASIVIEGVLPGESPTLTTMWVALGYPPCADVFAVWTGADGVPVELTGTTADNHSTQCDIVQARKAEVFTNHRGNGQHYLRLERLYNVDGTGYCQLLHDKNMEAYRKGYEQLQQRREALNSKPKHKKKSKK